MFNKLRSYVKYSLVLLFGYKRLIKKNNLSWFLNLLCNEKLCYKTLLYKLFKLK